MSAEISLFSGYSQKENRTTNYCLLVLKMLYEENPKFLAEVLGTLFDDESIAARVGVKFEQQVTKERSAPDGLIAQQAFTLYIETKHFDWFYDDQLKRHLEALNDEQPGLKVLLALGNFEGPTRDRFAAIEKLCESEYAGSLAFRAASFEELLGAIRRTILPKNLDDTVNDFKAYLDEQELLPTWRDTLDVVNCATSLKGVLTRQAYICPARGGSYNHSRCRFIGLYADKRVQYVADIRGVVDVDDGAATLLWNNGPERDSDAALNRAAAKIVDALPSEKHPRRVFLLGTPRQTDLRKDSKGGMQSSKLYFDIGRFSVKSAEELAQVLGGKVWSEFGH